MKDDIIKGIKIYTYLITILYLVTFNNNTNKQAVLQLMGPNRFEQYVYRSADFIWQISDFEHIKMVDRQKIIHTIVDGYFTTKNFGKNVMRYPRLMMFDQELKPKR